MAVRNEWNTYTLGRYSEQPDATKLRATVTQAEKDRIVTQVEKDRVVTQSEKDRTVSNDVSVTQTDHSKLKGTTKITDGTYIATITSEGYQDVKTHTPEKCYAQNHSLAATDAVIITPTAGKRIRVVSTYVSTNTVNVDILLSFVTSGDIFFKLYTAQKAAQAGNDICATGAMDETIKLTCGDNTFVSVGYDEI